MNDENIEIISPVVQQLVVAEVDGEPRCRDFALGEQLGFDRPRVIRELIKRNIAEIESFGCAPCRTAHMEVAMPRGGEKTVEVQEYWLNEEQALLVSVLSNAPNGSYVRAMLIRVFVAWRRGNLTPKRDASADLIETLADDLARSIIARAKEKIGAISKPVAQVVDMRRSNSEREKDTFAIVSFLRQQGDWTPQSKILHKMRHRLMAFELHEIMRHLVESRAVEVDHGVSKGRIRPTMIYRIT